MTTIKSHQNQLFSARTLIGLFVCIFHFSLQILPAQTSCLSVLQRISETPNEVFFLDTLKGFIATRGEVLKTLDGGENWEQIDCLNTNGSGGIFNFPNLETGYFFDRAKTIFKTSDGGLNWDRLNTGFDDDINDIFFINPDTGYVAMRSKHLLRTEDGGLSWQDTLIQSGFDGILDVQFVNDTVGFVLGSNNLLLRANLNYAWDTLEMPVNPTLKPGSIWFEDENRGWVIASLFQSQTYEIYQTTDGGQNWTIFQDLPPLYNWHVFDFENMYALSGSDSLRKTNDGGLTWNTLGGPFPFKNLFGIHFLDENWGMVVGGSGFGGAGRFIAKTRDGGQSWEALANLDKLHISDLSFPNDSVGYFINEKSAILKSTDRGMTWLQVYEYDGSLPIVGRNEGRQIHFFDELNGVAFSTQLMIKTQDGGQTWNTTIHPINNLFFDAAQFYTDSIWVINNLFGASNSLYFTYDAGVNWTTVPSNLSFWDLHVVNPDTLIAPISNTIYRSTDGGSTWNAQYVDTDPNTVLLQIEFVNDSVGFVGGNDGLFLKTTDQGLTWTSINSGTTLNFQIMTFYDENLGYVSRRDFDFIYEITNGGQDWRRIVVGPDISTINILNPDLVYLAGQDAEMEILSPQKAPCQPSFISGVTKTCLGMLSYSVTVEGRSRYEYIWEVSGGGSLSPNGNTVNITWADTGQHIISVRQVNDCDTSIVRQLMVQVNDVATPTISIVDGYTLVTDAKDDIQWYLNGRPIPDATKDTLFISTQGNYTVQNINECGSAFSSMVTSLDSELTYNYTIYPNPASDLLRIESTSIVLDGEWEIINSLGQSILTGNLEQGYVTDINVRGLKQGVYFLHIKSERERELKKIIIQ